MLLKPLNLDQWIEIGADWDQTLDLKAQLLTTKRETVLAFLAEAATGVLELHQTLGEFLGDRYPDRYGFRHGQMRLRGRVFERPETGESALEQIAQWTQEDWAVLSHQAPVRLIAGTVCFPSRWSLPDKMGKDSRAIHAPVPEFETIARPTETFLSQMNVEKPMWRINWTIHDSDKLHCPGPLPPSPGITTRNVLDRTWLRIERQTLRRLPTSKAVVFSIRTYIHPMRDVTQSPSRRIELLETLRRLPDAVAEYRGLKAFRANLEAALESIAD